MDAGVVDQFLTVPKDDPTWHEISLASACYPASLAYGKIGLGHPMAACLEKWGVKARDLGWFEVNARKPDILGYNFYPDFAFGWGESKEQRTEDFTKDRSIPLILIVRHT